MWPVLWAQSAVPTAEPFAPWLQLGFAGAVLLAILRGWLWPRPPVDRLLKDMDRMREEHTRERAEDRKQLEALIAEVHALATELRGRRGDRG